MDILLQLISYSFIPLLGILVISGLSDIFLGLKEHFELSGLRLPSLSFSNHYYKFSEKFRIGRFQSKLCRS